MIRSSASRILLTSRHSLRPFVGKSFHSKHSSHSHGGLSHLLGSSQSWWSYRGDERQTTTQGSRALPRISLDPRDPLVLLTRRCFSSSTSSSDPSFRERMEARRDQGREAAAKGAHSLRGMIQKYGMVFLGTYFVVYFSTLATLFAGIESGVLDPAYVMSWVSSDSDAKSTVAVVVEFMDHYSWTRPYKSYVQNNPEVANLGVAWIAVKFTEPIRFGTTVAIVPRLSRYLGYTSTEDATEIPPEIEDEKTSTAKSDPSPK